MLLPVLVQMLLAGLDRLPDAVDALDSLDGERVLLRPHLHSDDPRVSGLPNDIPVREPLPLGRGLSLLIVLDVRLVGYGLDHCWLFFDELGRSHFRLLLRLRRLLLGVVEGLGRRFFHFGFKFAYFVLESSDLRLFFLEFLLGGGGVLFLLLLLLLKDLQPLVVVELEFLEEFNFILEFHVPVDGHFLDGFLHGLLDLAPTEPWVLVLVGLWVLEPIVYVVVNVVLLDAILGR